MPKESFFQWDVDVGQVVGRLLAGGEVDIPTLEKAMVKYVEDQQATRIPSLFEQIRRSAPRLLKSRYAQRRRDERDIHRVWGRALDLLEILWYVVYRYGEAFTHELVPPNQSGRATHEVLSRLQGRAARTGQEILLLLRGGYADGAMSRWRLLHEIAVVAQVVVEEGDKAAESYLRHEVVQELKAAYAYKKFTDSRPDLPKVDEDDLADLKNRRDELGPGIGNNFGWAKAFVEGNVGEFETLEVRAGLEDFHPYYLVACNTIHATSKALEFTLGLFPSDEGIILAGPSMVGLGTPARCMARSLLALMAALWRFKPTLTTNVVMGAINRLFDDIANILAAVETVIAQADQAAITENPSATR